MCAAKLEIGNHRHFQSAARCKVLEIRAVWGDEELSSKEARSLSAKTPGNVGLFRLDLLQVNSVRQKKCEPRFPWHRFRIRFVDLNFDVAKLHVDLGEPPLPQ